MKEPDRHGKRQRFRAKHFYRTRSRAEFELTTTDNFCDSIVRIEFDCAVTNVACSLPCLNQLEETVKQESEIDSEQRECESLIQAKRTRRCCGWINDERFSLVNERRYRFVGQQQRG